MIPKIVLYSDLFMKRIIINFKNKNLSKEPSIISTKMKTSSMRRSGRTMNKRNKKNTLPSLVQKYQAENVILEIQHVLKAYNIEMFLCIRDSKTQCVEAISTDHDDFGLKDVGALILNKKVAFMKFNEYEDLIQTTKPVLEEPEEKVVEDEALEHISNEGSVDSKKLTVASTLHEQISEANSGAEIKSDATFDDQMSTHKFEVVEPSVMEVESPKEVKVEEHQP